MRLDDESLLEVDIVVSAVGLKPRIQLVKDTLACRQGILVNRALKPQRGCVCPGRLCRGGWASHALRRAVDGLCQALAKP